MLGDWPTLQISHTELGRFARFAGAASGFLWDDPNCELLIYHCILFFLLDISMFHSFNHSLFRSHPCSLTLPVLAGSQVCTLAVVLPFDHLHRNSLGRSRLPSTGDVMNVGYNPAVWVSWGYKPFLNFTWNWNWKYVMWFRLEKHLANHFCGFKLSTMHGLLNS